MSVEDLLAEIGRILIESEIDRIEEAQTSQANVNNVGATVTVKPSVPKITPNPATYDQTYC